VVLVLWGAISPFRWERYDVDSDRFARPIETTGRCESEHGALVVAFSSSAYGFMAPFLIILGFPSAGVAFWTIFLLFNIGILSFASHQAFVARKIAIEFAESEHISLAISTTLVASFVACPVMWMVGDQPRAYYFVRCAFVFVVSMALLLFIFLPKIIYSRQNGSQNFEAAVKTSLDRLQTGSASQYRRPRDVSDLSPPDDDQVGALVVDHPKLRKEKENELIRLAERNKMLELRLAEYDTVSKPEEKESGVSSTERIQQFQGSRNTDDSLDDVRVAAAIGETYLKSVMGIRTDT
jgi:hypothetical protein